MISVWTVVEQMRVASGAAELAIFTAILYWFFTSSRVADMLEVVGERVGGWCGRDTSLRQAMLSRRRQYINDMYSKLDTDITQRTSSLYRVKDGPIVPAPQPQSRPQTGLACARCAPLSRESWNDPKAEDNGAVINILDISKLTYANGGVVSRWLCDITRNFNLRKFDFKDEAPSVEKDATFLRAIEDVTEEELRKTTGEEDGSGEGRHKAEYETVRRRVEVRAKKILQSISSAMSTNVLRTVAWVSTKAIRRIADGGCGTRWSGLQRVRRANAAGLPLVFVPLHRSHLDYVLVTFVLYLAGLRPPLVAAGDNMRIPFFGWFLRGCGAFYIRRRVDGNENHGDPIYKAALRAYILNSLSANNNLEFFIEGGRTRTGKPQPPKAGILSVIMDAYLDGTIDDALLVPVTLNYDRLVDGNFVREQLGMPKQMETFWSALRGIWKTLNTNHGSIRVDYNQPISLKELVTSFQKYNYYKAPLEKPLTPPDNNLAVDLDRQILYNHSHSSLYGDDVSTEHKIMVEAIGRHLVYDASRATSLMCTNVVSYVLLTERRRGCTMHQLQQDVLVRAEALHQAGRDLAHAYNEPALTRKALELLGRGLVRRESGQKQWVRPQPTIPASIELSYYANSVVVHYAAPAILATALESVIVKEETDVVTHTELMDAALKLCEILSEEFILCAPCQRIEERIIEAIDELVSAEIIINSQPRDCLEEEKWSRRFASRLEEEEEEYAEERPDPSIRIKYKVSKTPEAIAERRRLVSTIRPLLEAYAGTCRCLSTGTDTHKAFMKRTLDHLTYQYTNNNMIYGESVSTDAIRNCLKLLRQWGVLEIFTENKERMIRVRPHYENKQNLDTVCDNIYRFNMDTPLLTYDV